MATHTASWTQPTFPNGRNGFDRAGFVVGTSISGRAPQQERRASKRSAGLVMVILRVLVLPLVIAAVLLMALAPASTAVDSATRVETYVVVSGDTLWDIAAGLTDPSGDVRATIDEIEDLNGLTSSALQPGQSLLIPRPF
ncbi:MAG: LysM peptidoglycan-binding domain-containing protein [Acidimicrobiia bacterium]|nr:LysM peptidoglycan-binding domain-containing protein [Acidimicrobiia bacterium]NNL28260.1 LysM peptidoglycan-binding domain-containing protein [Acidimicrobiia bacterium]NNL48114.1 LysM peptidoglycan-binding domain-containing protein [Acidimicrobiia bacterium]